MQETKAKIATPAAFSSRAAATNDGKGRGGDPRPLNTGVSQRKGRITKHVIHDNAEGASQATSIPVKETPH
jgi:hypothetical protein